MCCHTEIEVADPTFYLTRLQYTDTGSTSPSADPTTPGAWQGSHWNANLEVTGMTRPGKIPSQVGFEPGFFRSRGGHLNHKANEAVRGKGGGRWGGGGRDTGIKRYFARSSHGSDVNTGSLQAALPGAWRDWVSARTGWPGVRVLRLGEIGCFDTLLLSQCACGGAFNLSRQIRP